MPCFIFKFIQSSVDDEFIENDSKTIVCMENIYALLEWKLCF